MKHFPLFFLLIVETMKWKVMSSCITRLSILTFRQIFIKKISHLTRQLFSIQSTVEHSHAEKFSAWRKINVTFASKRKSMWRLRQNENQCDVCVKMKINVTFASKRIPDDTKHKRTHLTCLHWNKLYACVSADIFLLSGLPSFISNLNIPSSNYWPQMAGKIFWAIFYCLNRFFKCAWTLFYCIVKFFLKGIRNQ